MASGWGNEGWASMGIMKDPIQRQLLFEQIGRFGAGLLQGTNTYSRTPVNALAFGANALQQGGGAGEAMKRRFMAEKLKSLQQQREGRERLQKLFSGAGGQSGGVTASQGSVPGLGAVGATGTPTGVSAAPTGSNPIAALLAKATPQQKQAAMAMFQMGDYKGAVGALTKRPSGLPVGTRLDENGRVVSIPGAEDIIRGRNAASAPKVYSKTIATFLGKEAALVKAEERARENYAKTGDKKYLDQAQRLALQIKFPGGKIPADLVNTIRGGERAYEGYQKLANLTADKRGFLNPQWRSEVNQQLASIKSAQILIEKRGANFTPNEERIIKDLSGADPTSLYDRILRDPAGMQKSFKIAADAVKRETERHWRVQTSPRGPQFKPWKKSGNVPAIKSDDDYRKLPSGTKFRDPNGVMRIKP